MVLRCRNGSYYYGGRLICQQWNHAVWHIQFRCNNRLYEFMHEIYTILKWKICAQEKHYSIIELICGNAQVRKLRSTNMKMKMPSSCALHAGLGCARRFLVKDP